MKSGSWELIRTVSLTTFCTLLSSLPQSVLISSLHLLSWHWNHLTRCLFPTSFFDPRGGYPDIKALEIFIHCSLPPITYYLFFLYNCIHFFLSFLWHLYSILHYIITLFSPQSLLGDPETSILWDQYPWFCRPVKEGLSEVPTAYLVFLPRHMFPATFKSHEQLIGCLVHPHLLPELQWTAHLPLLQSIFRRTVGHSREFLGNPLV